jgi:hypothetical protein
VHELLAAKNFERDTRILTSAFCTRSGWGLMECAFPIIDLVITSCRDLRLRLTCNDWDELPPSITLLQADGTNWPSPPSGGIFNASAHPSTGLPFICMRGVREYHTHSSHLNESWASYRGQHGMDLVGLIAQVTNAWHKLRMP